MVSFSSLFMSGVMATAALAAPHHSHERFHQKRSTTKLGAAYNDASLVSLVTGAAWAYNWGSSADGSLPNGIEYVPMLWGEKSFDGWNSAIESALGAGAKTILGFNEPDSSSQANISPGDAVTYYKQYILPYAHRAQLVTPAVTNGANGMGLDWMSEYLNICAGTCGQTAMAIHWYDDANNVDYFKEHVTNAISLAAQHNIQKIWITEFAATGDAASQVTFLGQVLPWLESQGAVERYAYFMTGDGTLLSGNGLSSVGRAYVDA